MTRAIIGLVVFSFLLIGVWWINIPFLDTKKEQQLTVLASNEIIADTLNQLLSDSVDIDVLISSKSIPFNYTPSSNDIKKIKQADIIVINGLQLEGALENTLNQKRFNQKQIINLESGIKKKLLLKSDVFPAGYDPHIWHDLDLWSEATQYLSTQLQLILPNQSDEIEYRKNS